VTGDPECERIVMALTLVTCFCYPCKDGGVHSRARAKWAYLSLGCALACGPSTTRIAVGSGEASEGARFADKEPATDAGSPLSRGNGAVESSTKVAHGPEVTSGTPHERLCLTASDAPIPRCVESRTSTLPLPLRRAIYLEKQAEYLEAGGLAASLRTTGRADRNGAVFVQVEGERVIKVVRDQKGGERSAFLAEAGYYRLRTSDGSLSLLAY
jgi:hypothetical protein